MTHYARKASTSHIKGSLGLDSTYKKVFIPKATSCSNNGEDSPSVASCTTTNVPNQIPRTEALYLDDASLRTLTTEILSSQPIPSLSEEQKTLVKNVPTEDNAITTRQTIFYAQGGGQPSDTGAIAAIDQNTTFEVSLVRKTSDGLYLHFGKYLDSSSPFAEGQHVVQRVDDSKRNYHSRLHSAGHIVGLAMQLLMPEMKKVKANHFPGEAAMEYEGLLYNEHKRIIQEKVDELVSRDLPILMSWLEGGVRMGDGEGFSRDGRTRIASIGGLDHNACGGTHVARTGLVGSVVIRKISRQKGVSRVAYDVSAGVEG
ncbi:Translation elongation/initiation factor/Ribosomal beta-barrel [Penicillium paradoxum]|uniref:Translation elongation/initiation factor/Ribosomal beta-barrel n=1 Tax=Penicillium paradoxum TaxID=176176 RepID=UPI002547453E|nr:Translation elongation/initiation factor/Ribosomal beta-barrel [Penicillium paradoxum]KAJ5773415.1 Translation elongation/initiation factor/Ribosomal beta-barrel [Penicillium paradoxum]